MTQEIRRLSTAELEQSPPDSLYLLVCTGYGGQFWNERGGYGINPLDAKLWTRDEAIQQIQQGHERREVAVSADAYVAQARAMIARVETEKARRSLHDNGDETTRHE